MRILRYAVLAALLVNVAATPGPAGAQSFFNDDSTWKEGDTPPPPGFNPDRLVAIEMPPFMALRYGVDPETVSIGADSVVRYVIVATSASGARNAVYEGIHCASGRVKTYARSSGTDWRVAESSDWRPIGNVPYAHAFARQGACQGAAPASSVRSLLRTLKGTQHEPTS
ncbi:CNP1-like family protein [Ramlibacter sp. H39-3-26]|uniref:CNP1-like family protein n=1 Tax=Curvibacter soli TaxID=3031331 RepID=UPI0023DC7807|nr:CNP1-like family protein [Ramlibacter sp. H39-3-26]MDF1485887.1 CNP1-like family protein [Ramlibacter sp. H39-3-26]